MLIEANIHCDKSKNVECEKKPLGTTQRRRDWSAFFPPVSIRPCSVADVLSSHRRRDVHTCALSSATARAHTLTPRLRLRRQCILGLEAMKSLRRWERGSLGCLGDWESLGTAEGEGGGEAGGVGGGWCGDINRDISYR